MFGVKMTTGKSTLLSKIECFGCLSWVDLCVFFFVVGGGRTARFPCWNFRCGLWAWDSWKRILESLASSTFWHTMLCFYIHSGSTWFLECQPQMQVYLLRLGWKTCLARPSWAKWVASVSSLNNDGSGSPRVACLRRGGWWGWNCCRPWWFASSTGRKDVCDYMGIAEGARVRAWCPSAAKPQLFPGSTPAIVQQHLLVGPSVPAVEAHYYVQGQKSRGWREAQVPTSGSWGRHMVV